MAAAEEFRTDVAALAKRLDDARGCVHVTDEGAMFTHDERMVEGEICVEDGDFADAMFELREVVDETAERIDALTNAVAELHGATHPPVTLALCPRLPCSGLRRYLPNAHGVVPV